MRSSPISEYIGFGFNFRLLMDAHAGMPVHEIMWILPVIEKTIKQVDEFGLIVTKRATKDLLGIQERLKESAPDHQLTKEEAEELGGVALGLRQTLFAEAQGSIAFIVTSKRYDVNRLLSDVGSLFPPGVYSRLPDIARLDFDEAGKCIAFERSTAAAFHLLRGTEAVLRAFYLSTVKRDRAELMWGPMVTSLRNRKKGKPPDVLLNNLDNIRLSFRNPTQHPEKVYDIQEAQDLLGLCVDIVNRMIAWIH